MATAALLPSLPGNAACAVGLGEAAAHEDGSLNDPAALAAMDEWIASYVARRSPVSRPSRTTCVTAG